MKFFNLIVLSLFVYNVVLAKSIKKECKYLLNNIKKFMYK